MVKFPTIEFIFKCPKISLLVFLSFRFLSSKGVSQDSSAALIAFMSSL